MIALIFSYKIETMYLYNTSALQNVEIATEQSYSLDLYS